MKNNLKLFLGISSLLVLPGIASIHFIRDYFTDSNTSFNIQKDNTRLGSSYYGLNWGSRTDELVNII